MKKQVRAHIHYIFSLVASLLAAEQKNIPSRSGRCVLRHMPRRVAGGVLAARVLMIYAPSSLSFLVAQLHG
jgi:hypothetical protein